MDGLVYQNMIEHKISFFRCEIFSCVVLLKRAGPRWERGRGNRASANGKSAASWIRLLLQLDMDVIPTLLPTAARGRSKDTIE